VVKAQNRLDGRFYAVKKIALDPQREENNRKILREVMTLSRLHHQYVVRYYQAWLENDDGGNQEDLSITVNDHDIGVQSSTFSLGDDWLSMSGRPSSNASFIQFANDDDDDPSSDDDGGSGDDADNKTTQRPLRIETEQIIAPARTLYLQMEYCEKKTLQDAIAVGLDISESWRIFRQIVEALVHIHSQGMVHRDLKPTNIFLDGNGDVKIGDFGLATQLTLTEANQLTGRMSAASPVGDESLTSAVGTSLYIGASIIIPL
jgi:translation initiation factor 2-alpha kinase 4